MALAAAGLLLAAWLWQAGCKFPSVVWNDLRLAPAIALAQGWPIFPTATEGTINTWTYGPLPTLYYLPAALAGSAGGALIIAAGLNLLLTLIPIAAVCFGWPAGDPAGDSRRARLAAFLLCVALWPPRSYEVIFADNLAIACGLLGSLVLVRARRPAAWWLAALLATAAVGCKQIALGPLGAQVLWIACTENWRSAGRHALRCALVGLGWVAVAAAVFGGPGLWHTLIRLPANFPWSLLPGRLLPMLPEVTWQVGAPLLVMIVARRGFTRPALLLPALGWACALPFGILALLKAGGWTNSLHSIALWLPPAATVLFTSHVPRRVHHWMQLGAAVAVIGIVGGRVSLERQLFLRPAVASYAEAEELAAQFRHRIWFPFHPLVTLFSDRRYYHDEDGLYVRAVAQQSIDPQQAAAHLPPSMQVMARHNDWSDWGIARAMFPAQNRQVVIGHWTLWLAGEKLPRP